MIFNQNTEHDHIMESSQTHGKFDNKHGPLNSIFKIFQTIFQRLLNLCKGLSPVKKYNFINLFFLDKNWPLSTSISTSSITI